MAAPRHVITFRAAAVRDVRDVRAGASSAGPAAPRAVAAAFASDSSSGDEATAAGRVNADLRAAAARRRAAKRVRLAQAKVLADDPTAYDYDAVYDSMSAAKGARDAGAAAPAPSDRVPRYLHNILRSAKEREIERERVMQRKAHKERVAEGSEFAGKDEYITPAYKRKLAEMERQDAEDRVRAAVEAAHGVASKTDMADFFGNLYKNNVAMGGGAAGMSGPDAARIVAEAMAAASRTPGDLLQEAAAQLAGSGGGREAAVAAPAARGRRGPSHRQQPPRPRPHRAAKHQEEPKAPVLDCSRRNTDTSVAAARARYLARKRARQPLPTMDDDD